MKNRQPTKRRRIAGDRFNSWTKPYAEYTVPERAGEELPR